MFQREKTKGNLFRHPSPEIRLVTGSRIAVIGSGPAGSLFSYFLLDMADRMGMMLEVDLFESRSFTRAGPPGCNKCGGIISESLVQNLAMEGVALPPGIVQRGIDSYVLHMDVGEVKIETPLYEMRIGAVHRGIGPPDAREPAAESFDCYLQSLALKRGANLVSVPVMEVGLQEGKPTLAAGDGTIRSYDLAVVAVGVNSAILKIFEDLGIGYERPHINKTLIREYRLGEEAIRRSMGTSMHVFLLRIPRLEFAAIIPKGEYATVCLLGENIDSALVDAFLSSPEVRDCMPAGWDPEKPSCQCLPFINVRGMAKPFADRFLFIGDCGITRLYKDGIGAAYRTAKAAARCALFEGVSEESFRRHYYPVCRSISADNLFGRLAFLFTRLIRHTRLLRKAVLRMTYDEQPMPGGKRRMSGVLWDMFSGSAPYLDIFRRMLSPAFLGRFLWSAAVSARQEIGHRTIEDSAP